MSYEKFVVELADGRELKLKASFHSGWCKDDSCKGIHSLCVDNLEEADVSFLSPTCLRKIADKLETMDSMKRISQGMIYKSTLWNRVVEIVAEADSDNGVFNTIVFRGVSRIKGQPDRFGPYETMSREAFLREFNIFKGDE